MNPLERRRLACEATKARFAGKAFAFGSVDCAKVTAFHLKQMGHKVRLSKAGQYSTLLGAQAACRRMGGETLPDVLDAMGFARIAPAAALMGDIVAGPGEHPIGTLGIYIGNQNFLGFHESHASLAILMLTAIDTAWRVPA